MISHWSAFDVSPQMASCLCFHATPAFTEHLLSDCCFPSVAGCWRGGREEAQAYLQRRLLTADPSRCCLGELRTFSVKGARDEVQGGWDMAAGVRAEVSCPLRSLRSLARLQPLPCLPRGQHTQEAPTGSCRLHSMPGAGGWQIGMCSTYISARLLGVCQPPFWFPPYSGSRVDLNVESFCLLQQTQENRIPGNIPAFCLLGIPAFCG